MGIISDYVFVWLIGYNYKGEYIVVLSLLFLEKFKYHIKGAFWLYIAHEITFYFKAILKGF